MSRASAPGKRRLRHAAGALLVLAVFALPTEVVASDTQKELNEAKERLKELRQEHEELKDQAAFIHSEIQSITARISQATAQIEALDHALEDSKEQIQSSRKEAERLQTNLDNRARDAYIRGPAGALELVLDADSLTNLADRYSYLDILSEADAQVAAGLDTEREQIDAFRDNVREYVDEKEKLLAALEGEGEQLQIKFDELAAAQASAQEKVEEAQKVVEKLETQLQEELLAQYALAGNPAAPPPSADGPFYWCPVGSPRSYIDDFGFPRVGHTHQGNDIFAPEGTPIHAPFDGVAEEGLDGLGGIVVHVYASANADYVYNAHLVKHAGVDGATVKRGDIIGYVGNTGNAAGTPPHDHFEYHPGGGSAVSPYVYLNEVCGVGGVGN